jgi:hypothetical protein
MKTFQILGLVLVILGLIGFISGTGPLLAQLLVLGLGVISLIYGYIAKK